MYSDYYDNDSLPYSGQEHIQNLAKHYTRRPAITNDSDSEDSTNGVWFELHIAIASYGQAQLIHIINLFINKLCCDCLLYRILETS